MTPWDTAIDGCLIESQNMVYDTDHMEQFQLGYVRQLISQAAAICSVPEIDRDSIDIEVTGIAKNYADCLINRPKFEAQLKTTSNLIVPRNGFLHYSLKINNYNDIVSVKSFVPRYLFLMLMPKNSELWMQHLPNCSLTFKRCYWVSLEGLQPSSNEISKTILIPEENVMSANTIIDLLKSAANRDGRIYGKL